MVFEMSLRQDPFSSIQKGTKTVELRLYDEKRARLNIGDYIVFTNLADTTRLAVQITALYRFASFKDLFSDIDLRSCGFDAPLTAYDAAKVMEKYYSREEISVYGVLGIRIQLKNLDDVLSLREAAEEASYEYLFPDGMK